MKIYKEYFRKDEDIVDEILKTQGEQIEKASQIVSDSIGKDGLIHSLGVVHSLIHA